MSRDISSCLATTVAMVTGLGSSWLMAMADSQRAVGNTSWGSNQRADFPASIWGCPACMGGTPSYHKRFILEKSISIFWPLPSHLWTHIVMYIQTYNDTYLSSIRAGISGYKCIQNGSCLHLISGRCIPDPNGRPTQAVHSRRATS